MPFGESLLRFCGVFSIEQLSHRNENFLFWKTKLVKMNVNNSSLKDIHSSLYQLIISKNY